MQEKLFEVDPIKLPRPTYFTIDRSLLYQEVANILYNWSDVLDKNYIFNRLKESSIGISYFLRDDGYNLAKKLEDELGIDPDSDLVSDLDYVSHEFRKVLDEEIKKWVIRCKITPKYKEGDFVEYKLHNNKMMSGEIQRIDLDKAIYHIRKEPGKESYILINFEDVHEL